MSREVRRDPLTGQWVVLSSDRLPAALLPPHAPRQDAGTCPFCPGHEAATPPTIRQIERDGRWVARAFPNRRPALVIEEELRSHGHGPYDRVSGTGAHEVIVESPDHDTPLQDQPVAQLTDALLLARWRLADLQKDPRFAMIWWFRNHGAAAGASLDHPHAQLLATPMVSSRVREIGRRSRRHLRDRGRELLQDVVDHERDHGRRIVWEGERVIALCPFAPVTPFEVLLVPTQPGPSFASADDRLVEDLAAAMRTVLRAYARVLDGPAHHAWMVNAPMGRPAPGFRWHLRMRPKLVVAGGFEAATGEGMHWVWPEEAASALRG